MVIPTCGHVPQGECAESTTAAMTTFLCALRTLHAPEAQSWIMANALVWGGEGGIGAALVRTLIAEGWQVAAMSRKIGSSEATVALEVDVTSTAQIEEAVLEVAQTLGEINLGVYAVGDIVAARVGALGLEEWERIMGANLGGAFLTTRASLSLLAPDAHLVYLGALPDQARRPGLAAYAAAKAGLEAFADVLAKEEPAHRVTVVRFGAVESPLWSKVGARAPRMAAQPDAIAAEILAAHSHGHQGLLDL